MPPIARLYDSNELAELTLDIFATACDKGWWPFLENPRLARGKGSAKMTVFPDGEIEEKVVLVGTELSESMEEYRSPDVDINMIYYNIPSTAAGGYTKVPHGEGPVGATFKPEGFAVEMADAYIRILDLLGALNSLPDPFVLDDDEHPKETKVGKHLFKIKCALFKTAVLSQPTLVLSEVLCLIERACSDLGADLALAIKLKTAYNKTRSFKHGNKRA